MVATPVEASIVARLVLLLDHVGEPTHVVPYWSLQLFSVAVYVCGELPVQTVLAPLTLIDPLAIDGYAVEGVVNVAVLVPVPEIETDPEQRPFA